MKRTGKLYTIFRLRMKISWDPGSQVPRHYPTLTNMISAHFNNVIFWASLAFVILGIVSVYGGCNTNLFMKVFLSIFSINCMLISCFIIMDTITAWNIDIWDLDMYREWDYLTPQHLYMETLVGAACLELVLDILTGCLSYSTAGQDKRHTGRKVTVESVSAMEDNFDAHELPSKDISGQEIPVEVS